MLNYQRVFNYQHLSQLVVDLPPWKIWVRQIGSSSQLLGKIKNVPNHQHLRLLKLIPTYCAKNTCIHCTPSLRWLNLSKQSTSRNLQTMSAKRIWIKNWIDCTQKQRQICPQDDFVYTCSNMAKNSQIPIPVYHCNLPRLFCTTTTLWLFKITMENGPFIDDLWWFAY